ncbi:MAG TPA: hypothetical protein VLB27_02365, partial [candidate division Zixibacteria bacterium]|nr:hypothetical protein [candidate division Zixibacteria bacterium]
MNRAHARLALISGILMLALGGINYLSFYPLLVEPDEPQVYGAPLLRADGAAVVLLVDTGAIRDAGSTGSFSATDWSYGWLNLLLQEEKRFDILDVTSNVDLSRYQLAIFTRSAAPAAPALLRQSHPLRVVIETPPAATLDSLTGGAVTRDAAPLTVHLDEFDFDVVTDPLTGDDLRPALTLSGETLATEFTRNDQTVIFTAFDFGALAVETQQGRPNDDFSVTPHVSKKTGRYPLVTSDLVADSSYFERFTPFFDLFEHRFWSALSGGRPATPLWDNSPRGAFVMSHDEEGVGRHAAWMAQQENRWGVRSATLVTPAAVDSAALAAIYQAGGEVGLHVDKYSYFDRPGLPGLRPLRTVFPVAEQIRRLKDRGARELVVNRTHWLQWSDHYTKPLRILAAAGVQLDLSYGPLSGALV